MASKTSNSPACEWCGDGGLVTTFKVPDRDEEIPVRVADLFAFRRDHPERVELAAPCPCAPRRKAKRRLSDLLGDNGPKAIYQHFTFKSWDALPEADKAGKEEARYWCEQFAQGPFEKDGQRRIGLILSGRTGATKSGLATCVLREWITRGTQAAWLGFGDLMDCIKDTYGSNSEISTGEMISRLINIPLLLLDDLGSGRGVDFNDHTRNVLWRVLNGRYEALMPMVITTNLDWPKFKLELGDALAYRLIQVYEWQPLDGRNLRAEE